METFCTDSLRAPWTRNCHVFGRNCELKSIITVISFTRERNIISFQPWLRSGWEGNDISFTRERNIISFQPCLRSRWEGNDISFTCERNGSTCCHLTWCASICCLLVRTNVLQNWKCAHFPNFYVLLLCVVCMHGYSAHSVLFCITIFKTFLHIVCCFESQYSKKYFFYFFIFDFLSL